MARDTRIIAPLKPVRGSGGVTRMTLNVRKRALAGTACEVPSRGRLFVAVPAVTRSSRDSPGTGRKVHFGLPIWSDVHR